MCERWGSGGQLAAAAGVLDAAVLDELDAEGADSVLVLVDELDVLADSLAVEPLRESVR